MKPSQGNERLGRGGAAPSRARLADALVGAYGDSEQRVGLFTMIEEHLGVSFDAELLGAAVVVERVDLTDADEIVTVCRRVAPRQRVPILDHSCPSRFP